MPHGLSQRLAQGGARALPLAFLLFSSAFLARPIAGQQETGPLPGPPPVWEPIKPPPGSKPPQPAPAPKAPASNRQSSGIQKDPPSIPAEQIIQQFAAREAEFKTERDNFTYTQMFVVETIDDDTGRPDGEYRMTSDITFTPSGRRYENITDAPAPTLERVTLSEQDFNDLRNIQPFVLTTDELPKYNVTYVGREKIDEIGTYVFDVAPKTIEKNQRYFQGRVWVDDRDLEIVKTFGKAVPDIIKKNNENIFPRFETWRENIEGHYWFPTYTHADDFLKFRSGAIHLRMTVRYTNYKRFRTTVRLVPHTAVPVDQPNGTSQPAGASQSQPPPPSAPQNQTPPSKAPVEPPPLAPPKN